MPKVDAPEQPADIEVVLVDSTEEVESFLRWLGQERPILAFDLETTGVDPWRDRIRLAQFGDAMTGWSIPYHRWSGLVEHVMREYEGPIGGWNIKFDAGFLERDGLHLPRERAHDGMVMANMKDSHAPKGLKRRAASDLGSWASRGERELKEGMHRGKWGWHDIPLGFEPYWVYGAQDTIITARECEYLWPRIQDSREAYEREVAVAFALMDMELAGLRVDVDYCRATLADLEQQMGDILQRWPDVPLTSNARVIRALQAGGVRFVKKTEKGHDVLDVDVLETIDHPLARDTLEFRNVKKLAGTYIGPFLDLQVDGVLHPNINPLGAEKTGRMSINRPSMQNLPRRRLVRDAIVASEGRELVLVDYSAQEMRLLAHESGDERMIQAFRDGVDLHSWVASQVYGVDEPSKQQRQTAKSSAFAKVYGAGLAQFARTAGISQAEAKSFLARYDRLFPSVARFMSDSVREVRRTEVDGFGHVRTIGGRTLQVPVGRAYVAVNYKIQGGCSDVTKQAIVNLVKAGVARFARLPVHDEVIFDIPLEDVEDAVPTIVDCMERDDLLVPMIVEVEHAQRWGDSYAA